MMKHCFYIILSVLFCGSAVQAQTIRTIAGIGTPGSGGDGLPATAAQLHSPTGIATDAAGNIYIADQLNHRIRMVDHATGIMSTFAGTGTAGYSGNGGPATAARFNEPNAIAIDPAGNIYITDFAYSDVRKIDVTGNVSSFAGNYLASGNTGDGGPATAALLFDGENTLATDVFGNVFICDMFNYRVRKVDVAGTITTVAGNGSFGYSGDGSAATNAQLGPVNIAVDGSGNLFIADGQNYVVRKVSPAGIISTYAGNGTKGFFGDGGAATGAELSGPYALITDTSGSLFIGDEDNRIRKVNSRGIISTIAGKGTPGFSGDGGPATAGQMNGITGLALLSNCHEVIYVSDQGNDRIRQITYDQAPKFTAGHHQNFLVCGNRGAASLNTHLAVADSDVGQDEEWQLVDTPVHGTVVATGSSTSTGGLVTPTGLSYTAAAGFVGRDTFSVVVTDCGGMTDTTVVYVKVDTVAPQAGPLSGTDSVCIGNATAAFYDPVTGGTWSKSNTCAAVSSGVVAGVAAGRDTIYYILTNGCGSDTASRVIKVVDCTDGASAMQTDNNAGVAIYPNPNNGMFTINVSSAVDETARIVVSNMVGEKMKELSATTNTTVTVQMKQPPGVYFICVTTEHGTWSKRFVVAQ